MSFCCSRTCGGGGGCSCRAAAVSNVIFTDVPTDTFSLTVTPPATTGSHGMAPQLFSVNCYTNVNIQFAGTITYPSETAVPTNPSNPVLTLTLQYYNVATPGLINKVAVPLQAGLVQDVTNADVVPFTAVQTALLSTGTYSAQLIVSSGVTVPSVSVNGSMSVFMVRKSV